MYHVFLKRFVEDSHIMIPRTVFVYSFVLYDVCYRTNIYSWLTKILLFTNCFTHLWVKHCLAAGDIFKACYMIFEIQVFHSFCNMRIWHSVRIGDEHLDDLSSISNYMGFQVEECVRKLREHRKWYEWESENYKKLRVREFSKLGYIFFL
jgi:hypothetical protein